MVGLKIWCQYTERKEKVWIENWCPPSQIPLSVKGALIIHGKGEWGGGIQKIPVQILCSPPSPKKACTKFVTPPLSQTQHWSPSNNIIYITNINHIFIIKIFNLFFNIKKNGDSTKYVTTRYNSHWKIPSTIQEPSRFLSSPILYRTVLLTYPYKGYVMFHEWHLTWVLGFWLIFTVMFTILLVEEVGGVSSFSV